MREKKRSLYISILVIVISLIAALILYPHTGSSAVSPCNFLETVFMGIFCSAVAALFILINDYNEEKRRALKQYSTFVYSVYKNMDRLGYINVQPSGAPLSDGDLRSLQANCLLYENIRDTCEPLNDAFDDIDFFSDWPFFTIFLKGIRQKDADGKRFTQEAWKSKKDFIRDFYRDNLTLGKRKQYLRAKVHTPVMDYASCISEQGPGLFQVYQTGDSDIKNWVVSRIKTLQKLTYIEGKDGPVTNPDYTEHWKNFILFCKTIPPRKDKTFWKMETNGETKNGEQEETD